MTTAKPSRLTAAFATERTGGPGEMFSYFTMMPAEPVFNAPIGETDFFDFYEPSMHHPVAIAPGSVLRELRTSINT